MELFLVLIPVTIVLVGLSIWAFLWSARNEQFEDLEKQSYSILFDDDEPESAHGHAHQSNKENTSQ